MGGRNPDGTFAPNNKEQKERGRGLASLIKERTKDGHMLVEAALLIVQGKPVCVSEENPDGLLPAVKDVTWAIEWLADRGWGKATQSMEHTGAEGEALQVVVRSYKDTP